MGLFDRQRRARGRFQRQGQIQHEALPRRAEFFDDTLKGLSTSDIDTLNRILSRLEENFARTAARGRQTERPGA